ncbi:FAD-binding oxidoreductase [Microbaculum marinum]|uniref:FAD-binding oxidoreductase n=1 Tax=Microbaculum marinum TaxID=1764581 RepID=A0AAW9RJJ6_9HYPH
MLVIGGGTFGLFTALTLADRGAEVILIDRGGVWREASSVNAGSLGVQNKLPALVPYTLWAWELWLGLEARLGCNLDVRRNGGYKVATTEDEAQRLKTVAAEQEARGLTVSHLCGDDIRREAPWLGDCVVAATYSPDDGYASPTLLGPALRRAVEDGGVTVVEHGDVVSLSAGSRPRVETSAGAFEADAVAITAGAWSGQLAMMVGAILPVTLDVNMVSVTERAPTTIPKIVTHARGILTLKQVANMSCLIGGGWQGIGTLSDSRKEIDYDQLVHNLRLAQRVIPGLARLNVVRSWAGYEGVTPDSLPYLGRLPGQPNVYCGACARGGFTLGPLMGRLLGELIADGITSRPIDLFDPGRFMSGH